MKKHPWIKYVLIGLAVVVIAVSVSLAFVQAQLDKLKTAQLDTLDLTRVSDGTYEGSYTAFLGLGDPEGHGGRSSDHLDHDPQARQWSRQTG